MNLKEAVTPITRLKNDAARMIAKVDEERQTYVITQNGRARAVLMNVETYSQWREALSMLQLLALGEAEIAAGKGVSQKDAFRRAAQALRRSARDA